MMDEARHRFPRGARALSQPQAAWQARVTRTTLGCVCSGVETLSTAEIVEQIAELRRAHRALDEEIQRMPANPEDELQMKRLKKRKLQIKDNIIRLEMELVPDEPA